MNNPKIIAEELKNIYPYRIELHAHSNPASGCSEVPADELVRTFYNAGYDAIAVTNHFISDDEHSESKEKAIEKFKKDLYLAKETGEKLGIRVYAGAELRFYKHSNNDYLFFGFEFDELPDISTLILKPLLRSIKKSVRFLYRLIRSETE